MILNPLMRLLQCRSRICKKSLIVYIILFAALSVFSEEVKKGVLDLRNTNFNNVKEFTLKGEMGFYNRQFVFSQEDINKSSVFIPCPSEWSQTKLSDGTQLSSLGYGTYVFKILLPKNSPALML